MPGSSARSVRPESGKVTIIHELLKKPHRSGKKLIERPQQFRWVSEALPVAPLHEAQRGGVFQKSQVPELRPDFASGAALSSTGIGISAGRVDEKEIRFRRGMADRNQHSPAVAGAPAQSNGS